MKFKHKLKPSDELYRKCIREYCLTKNVKAKNKYKKHEYTSFANQERFQLQNFMKTLDGGLSKEKNAYHYASKTRQILDGANITNRRELVEERIIQNLMKYFTEYGKSHRFTSLVTYLACFIHYIQMTIYT